MHIRSKTEFFQLWEQGLLGNRPNLWRRIEDVIDAKPKTVGFRELGRAGGGAWTRVYDIDWRAPFQFAQTTYDWEGRQYIMDDGCPDDKQTLQGEVCRTYRGLEGWLGASQLPMRKAAAAGLLLPRSGATTLALIHRFMDPSSQDDLWDLMDLYPDATIEFTCFSTNVGVLPGRNTLIWEVRNY